MKNSKKNEIYKIKGYQPFQKINNNKKIVPPKGGTGEIRMAKWSTKTSDEI